MGDDVDFPQSAAAGVGEIGSQDPVAAFFKIGGRGFLPASSQRKRLSASEKIHKKGPASGADFFKRDVNIKPGFIFAYLLKDKVWKPDAVRRLNINNEAKQRQVFVCINMWFGNFLARVRASLVI